MGNTLSEKIGSTIGQTISNRFQRSSFKSNNTKDSSDENVSSSYSGQQQPNNLQSVNLSSIPQSNNITYQSSLKPKMIQLFDSRNDETNTQQRSDTPSLNNSTQLSEINLKTTESYEIQQENVFQTPSKSQRILEERNSLQTIQPHYNSIFAHDSNQASPNKAVRRSMILQLRSTQQKNNLSSSQLSLSQNESYNNNQQQEEVIPISCKQKNIDDETTTILCQSNTLKNNPTFQNNAMINKVFRFLSFPRRSHRQFLSSGCSIPHPEKVSYNGEDSFFISRFLLCVADGVGGNKLNGNNPAKYSRELTAAIYSLYVEKQKHIGNLNNLVHEAYPLILSGGSSTLLLLELAQDQTSLNSLQIGDSLFMIIRKEYKQHSNTHLFTILHKSQEMQIRFNCPFQVCSQNGLPESRRENIKVQDTDLIIMGSDGLFDNLTDESILDIVKPFWTSLKVKNIKKLSEELANQAHYMSLQDKVNVPFILKANQFRKNKPFTGGKKDDITVICSVISWMQQA